MKIKFLGTAAYEGVPAMYCQCKVCRDSLKTGGRALRTRSQALVDDMLLLDYNADTVCHFLQYRIDWNKVGSCLITHSHSDHLYPLDIAILSTPFTHEHRSLRFYSAKSGYDKIKEQIELHQMQNHVEVSLVKPGDIFQIEEGGFKVLVLKANHAAETTPVFYAIERGGKRLLYAHDTGVFYEEVYAQLKNFGRLDCISLDCTGCLGIGWDWRNGHMSLRTNLEVIERLKKEGIMDEKTIVVSNHYSHNGGQTYDEMVPEMAKNGIIVSYDGLEIEF